jgi:hypothetical protein
LKPAPLTPSRFDVAALRRRELAAREPVRASARLKVCCALCRCGGRIPCALFGHDAGEHVPRIRRARVRCGQLAAHTRRLGERAALPCLQHALQAALERGFSHRGGRAVANGTRRGTSG